MHAHLVWSTVSDVSIHHCLHQSLPPVITGCVVCPNCQHKLQRFSVSFMSKQHTNLQVLNTEFTLHELLQLTQMIGQVVF